MSESTHTPDLSTRRFIRQARDAAHQALFFLGLLDETKSQMANEAISEYAGFAMARIQDLVASVVLPAEPEPGTSDTTGSADRNAIETWKEIVAVCGAAHSIDNARASRGRFEVFLQTSRAERRTHRLLHHGLAALGRFFKKHAAWTLALVLVCFVALKVEAVNGLLVNEGFWAIVCLFLLLVPQILWKILVTLAKRRATPIPLWYIGGSAFWGSQAVEPGSLTPRWPHTASAFRQTGIGSLLRWFGGAVVWVALGVLAFKGGAPFLVLFAIATLVAGIWYFRTQWPQRMTILHAAVQGQLLKLCIYGLWWIVALGLVVIFRGSSTVTVFLILSMLYALLIAAYLLDFWDFLDPNPVRLLLLLLALVTIVSLMFGVGRQVFVALMIVGFFVYGIGYVRDRQRPLRLVLTLVCFFLAGVNILGNRTHRSAAWPLDEQLSQPLQRLAPLAWPGVGDNRPVVVVAASGGGSRAAVYAGLTLKAMNQDSAMVEIAEGIQAVSSVSGGSLSNAAYIARLAGHWEATGRLPTPDERVRLVQDLDTVLAGDFLLPTIQGMLTPGQTRGTAIEESWQWDSVALGDRSIDDLADIWRDAAEKKEHVPPIPLPLFNTSTLDGHDVVVTPIGKAAYTDTTVYIQAADTADNLYRRYPDPTWVYYRDAVLGLEDMLPDYNPSLAASVRASANFPFGFPLVEIRTQKPLFFSPRPDQKIVRLTDGGALSNSGMWSLYHLLANSEARLKDRGVLLIIVDAGKMPVYRNVQQHYTSLLGAIRDQSPIGQNLHRRMIDVLEQKYGTRLAVVKVDLTPRRSRNVMTTWALDERSLENLRATFEEQWTASREQILTSWSALRDTSATGLLPLIDRDRPPLD